MIGVIGGGGVAATNKLCELLEIRLTKNGSYRDAHHPEMLIYQATKVPSRSLYLERRGDSFIDDYIVVGKKLKAIVATILCMCCNTAHYAIIQIEQHVDLPFINIIEEVLFAVKDTRATNIGLIASDGCLKGKVYEKYFESILPTAHIIYPNKYFQQEVTIGICGIKNTFRFLEKDHPNRPQNIFLNVYKHLIDNGAEIVVIGCTDIRVDFHHENTIDSLEILVNKIYQMYLER
ncbi:Aspartate racemase [termite gut metagenome]|uniref:Aspartate racemase n=1 Tax=termite gut metagenome TaxID=433724 RepID=A0A5J4QFB9_9ZZZZ